MLSYKHILIATDLSDDFATVADTALTIAKRSNAKLSIVHVIEHTPVVYGGGEFSIPLDMNLEEHLSHNVRKALAEVGDRYGISADNQFVGHGSVKKEVLELAKQLNVDLIIVGSHGHSGVELLLGSVANAILHSANCDVLAVRIKSE